MQTASFGASFCVSADGGFVGCEAGREAARLAPRPARQRGLPARRQLEGREAIGPTFTVRLQKDRLLSRLKGPQGTTPYFIVNRFAGDAVGPADFLNGESLFDGVSHCWLLSRPTTVGVQKPPTVMDE